MPTTQLEAWTGAFGQEYLSRNSDTSEADIKPRADALSTVLSSCPMHPTSFLEVGANIGRNLLALRRLTSAELHAVEPFAQAYEKLRELVGSSLTKASCTSGEALPYDDASIDFVFTSGVLIHVAPHDLPKVMKEVVRVSRRYVWCNEYFSKKPEEISYRGHSGLLFKRDFGRFYCEMFPTLKPLAQGFLWSAVSPFDDTTWWLFEKRAA